MVCLRFGNTNDQRTFFSLILRKTVQMFRFSQQQTTFNGHVVVAEDLKELLRRGGFFKASRLLRISLIRVRAQRAIFGIGPIGVHAKLHRHQTNILARFRNQLHCLVLFESTRFEITPAK